MALKGIRFSVGSSSNNDNKENDQLQKMMKIGAQIQMLPDAILEEILCRLAAKSLFQCKSVSKPWFSLIDNLNFARKHFEKSTPCPLLVFDNQSGYKTEIIMHLVEGQTVADVDPEHGMSKLTSRMDFCFSDIVRGKQRRSSFLSLNWSVTSCEGMVCCTRRGCYPFLVCNPVTREYISVGSEYGEKIKPDEVSVFIGLGFSHVTKKFELLRMSRRKLNNIYTPWGPELRTVGTAPWRRVGDVIDEIDFDICEVAQVIYVNGAIYWTTNGKLYVCCFSFDTFDFQVVSVPRMESMSQKNMFWKTTITLGILAGSPCLSLFTRHTGFLETWALNNNGGNKASWNKLFELKTSPTLIQQPMLTRSYKMIKYLEDGKVLIHDDGASFIVYDLLNKVERHFRALEYRYLESLMARLHLEDAVPHVPSLVSLRDSLGESVKVFKASPMASLRLK